MPHTGVSETILYNDLSARALKGIFVCLYTYFHLTIVHVPLMLIHRSEPKHYEYDIICRNAPGKDKASQTPRISNHTSIKMLSCFHRYHALKLGHGLQGLGIQCPVIEVTDVVFKQWGHSRAPRLDVPIMAGVVCIHPVQPNESNKGANSKLAGALVEESTKLRPSGMSGSKKKEWIG